MGKDGDVFLGDSADAAPDQGNVAADADASEAGDALPDADAPSPDVSDVPTDAPCPMPGQATCVGRCTSIATDLSNCGACGRVCTVANGTPACVAGSCTVVACNTGFGDCDGNPATGCETPLTSTAAHCGRCGTACNASAPLCSAGTCSTGCAPGETPCGTACVNTQMNPSNCGACGNACPAMLNAMPACVAARCGFTCLAGFHLCGGVCVSNDATDSCGLSCSPCPTPSNALATCTAGGCGFTCLTGFADCDGVASNGCEVNLATTNAHCGRCGNACPASWTCVAGGCEGDLTLPATVQRWGANTVGDWDSIRNGLWDPPGGERYYFDTFADPAAFALGGSGGYYLMRVGLRFPPVAVADPATAVVVSATLQWRVMDNQVGYRTEWQVGSFAPTEPEMPTPADSLHTRWGAERFGRIANQTGGDPSVPVLPPVGETVTLTLDAAGRTYLRNLFLRSASWLSVRAERDVNNIAPPGTARAAMGMRDIVLVLRVRAP
jgi:hypothetical protein